MWVLLFAVYSLPCGTNYIYGDDYAVAEVPMLQDELNRVSARVMQSINSRDVAEAEVPFVWEPLKKKTLIKILIDDDPYSKALFAALEQDWNTRINKEIFKGLSKKQQCEVTRKLDDLNARVRFIKKHFDIKYVKRLEDVSAPEHYPSLKMGKDKWQPLPNQSTLLVSSPAWIDVFEYITKEWYFDEYEEQVRLYNVEINKDFQLKNAQRRNYFSKRYVEILKDDYGCETMVEWGYWVYDMVDCGYKSLESLGYTDFPIHLTTTTVGEYPKCRFVEIIYDENGIIKEEVPLFVLKYTIGGELITIDRAAPKEKFIELPW